MRIINLHEQRAAYATVLEELAQTKESAVITREGKALAVVVPYELYEHLVKSPVATDEVFERNRSAYLAMKPDLLKTHRGEFVAFHDGKLVDSDVDESSLVERVYVKYKGGLYFQLIDETEHVYHIRSPHLPRPWYLGS